LTTLSTSLYAIGASSANPGSESERITIPRRSSSSRNCDPRTVFFAFERDVRRPAPWPEIINTDQGCQFTSSAWIERVENNDIRVSMDGRGRWVDNIFIERFWRTIKHEHILIHSFNTASELRESVIAR